MSRKLITIIAVILVVGVGAVLILSGKRTDSEQFVPTLIDTAPEEISESCVCEGGNLEDVVTAYISGAVVSPGVYDLPAHSLLINLVEVAGGTDKSVDNLFVENVSTWHKRLVQTANITFHV